MTEFKTQEEKILWMLFCAGRKGVCSRTFYEEYLPRAGARIHELKKKGYNITSTPDGKYVTYVLWDGIGND